jgi:SLT domain-containing protein
MQTIASTFAGNRDPRLPNSMFDPLANIVAGINYINRRYGGIGNVQQANPNAKAKGYADGGLIVDEPTVHDNGGWLMPGDRGGVNKLSKPEAVLTPRESEAYVSQAKAAASNQGNTFTGTLYLANGALLGEFKAYSRNAELAAGPL